MAHPLVTISYADKEERKQIAQWLQDPLYYQDAFLLPTCPDPAWVNAGFLLIQNPNGQELVSVNFWAIKGRTKRESKTQTAETNKENQLLGFSIDYPSDIHLRNIREIDLALPNAHEARWRTPFEAFTWTVHAVFQKENPLQIRTRVRSAGGHGFPRMFALTGALQTPISGLHLEDKRYRDRIEYYATPEMFYNSSWAKLHGLQIKP